MSCVFSENPDLHHRDPIGVLDSHGASGDQIASMQKLI